MYRIWDAIIEPILKALQPKTLVEIGSDQGSNTRNLLKFCQQYGGKLHVIDPLPKYDVSAWQEQGGEHFVFHRALSLEALPLIDRFDAVLIDGDHNWYTVFNELKLIEERCRNSSDPFPLVMLHDIGWPYGRRDGYYNPSDIPKKYRQPHEQSGMRPESEELVGRGGLNRNLFNSVSENDPQNGVLTAVEDFLKETEQEIELMQIPGLHGLGILVPLRLKEENAGLATLLEVLNLPPTVAEYIELIEEARLEAEIGRQEQWSRSKRLKRRMDKKESQLNREVVTLEQENRALRAEIAEWEQKASQLEQKASQLIDENQDLTQQLQDIQNSRSWQLLSGLGLIRAKASDGKAQ